MGKVHDAETEVFRPTSGRITGALSLPVAAIVVVVAVLDGEGGFGPGIASAAALLGVLAWASMLRPGLSLTPEHLVMRNMLETIHIPLAAVEELAVRQVLAVRVGEKRFVSPVVGRPWRKLVRPGASQEADPSRPVTEMPYADYVEQQIRQRADDARARAGVRRGSDEQLALADGVRREPAWLPIALTALAAGAVVVSLLL